MKKKSHVTTTNTWMLLMLQFDLRNEMLAHRSELLCSIAAGSCQLLPFALYYLPMWMHVRCSLPHIHMYHSHTYTNCWCSSLVLIWRTVSQFGRNIVCILCNRAYDTATHTHSIPLGNVLDRENECSATELVRVCGP